jgi:hypothetical protein
MECSCGFCGSSFQQDKAQPTCASCPLSGSCQLVRCPQCNYENPVPPKWLNGLRGWFEGMGDKSRARGQ